MTDRQRARRAGRAAPAPRPHPLEQVLTGPQPEHQDGEQSERRREQQRDAGSAAREHRAIARPTAPRRATARLE